MSGVQVGDVLPGIEVRVTRRDLVRYAGAALDFNPIHWNEAFAREVGLPDVIAHGMLTMALAGRVVTDWGVGELVSYSARFTRPVVVPNDEVGALLELSGKVGAVHEDGTVRVNLDAKFEGKSVLGKAIAILRV
ncbi:MaoC/PaaZ C-terminal domain-containing protein [Actinokineospora auranticolor]|uniref:MaoC dehydratase-like protein n=1 Tax=Actinokineospora auranticolor TaxID=155976 RepID=A0A2S6GWC8_9PSEU|nr:MaoC/PaaZ C-terminal domain-containing protein [Actinokineospora auranticolor]PPK69496.1 MaoC dehydratase-like protein [Actinokineospora auranticolor]